jgi:O-antigen/teichoic acid export membrane protein
MVAAWVGTVVLSPAELRNAAVSSFPLVLYPAAFAMRSWHLGFLQAQNDWSRLARLQLIATGVSLGPFLGLIFFGQGILATAFQSLTSELVFTCLVVRVAAAWPIHDARLRVPELHRRFRSEFGQYAVMGILGMIQAQAEKILIGAFAGPSRLGSYATASSAARSVGDSFAMASGNVVRATLTGVDEAAPEGLRSRRLREAVDPIALRSVVLATAIAFAVGACAKAILPIFLGREWASAVQVVPILCITTVATALSWSLTPILRELGRLGHATGARVVTLFMAIPVAIAARTDLALAAWISVAREVVMLGVSAALCSSAAPRRAFAASSFGLLVTSVVVWCTGW